MANDYALLADVKARAFESTDYSGSTDKDDIFSALITTASRLIDREVGRWDGFFYPTTDAETRIYDGTGTPVLSIDEFTSITSVTMSDDGGVASTSYDALDSTDYFSQYYDSANYAEKQKPINRLVLDTLNGGETVFWRYPRAVKVTGIPGWSTTAPPEIKEACIIQVWRWFMRGKQNFVDVSSNGVASAMAFQGKTELDPDVKALLWPWKLELMP